MAKETEDKVWAQASWYLIDDPDPDGYVVRKAVTSVTYINLGIYEVLLDDGIAEAEEVLELCCSVDPKSDAMRQATVVKESPTLYTVRVYDSGGALTNAPVGFTVQRVRHTATP